MRKTPRSALLAFTLALATQGALVAPGHTLASGSESLLLRVSDTRNGDFTVIGNTMGWDCGTVGSPPMVGTIGSCGVNTVDTAPDILWRSDDANGTAVANVFITPALARTSALLGLSAGSTVTHAFLYWAGTGGVADPEVLLDRPDGAGGAVFSTIVSAVDSWGTGTSQFQCVADVTSLVQSHGVGVYRVSDLDTTNPANLNDDTFFAAWSMVVLYENAGLPLRNVQVWDGLDPVSSGNSCVVSLAGFEIPATGFDAKLGIVAYEGDDVFAGDELRFGQTPLGASDNLSNAFNPAGNVFNGTRTSLGAPFTMSGDLPRMVGTPGTMGGVDLDIFDLTSRVAAGQVTADIEALSSNDAHFVGVIVFSATTVATATDLPIAARSGFDLHSCAPNPFRSGTTIAFELARAQTVSLRVYDIGGRLIDSLLEGAPTSSGRHEVAWRGVDAQGGALPAGVYFYRLKIGAAAETGRMILVR